MQSVPGEGEKPQKFETLASILADARLNRLRLFPVPLPASPLDAGKAASIVAPDAEAIATASALASGDHVMLYASGKFETLTVREVKTADDVLTVRWVDPIYSYGLAGAFNAQSELQPRVQARPLLPPVRLRCAGRP